MWITSVLGYYSVLLDSALVYFSHMLMRAGSIRLLFFKIRGCLGHWYFIKANYNSWNCNFSFSPSLLLGWSFLGIQLPVWATIPRLLLYRVWKWKYIESEVAQSCLTLCDPVDCSPPGSSVHGILQARILEWIAIFFSRGSSWPRDRTQVSCISGRCFNLWATREALTLQG